MARTGLRPRKLINAKSYLIDLISMKKISHNFGRGYQFVCQICLFSMLFLSSADFFSKTNFSKQKIQEYHLGVKQFGSRSGPWFCQTVISKQQNLPQAEKVLTL